MNDYDLYINDLRTDIIANSVIDKNYGKSIEEIYYLIQLEYEKYASHYCLPGSNILLYPSIKERHAMKNYYSTFDGAPIHKGSLYINYHALLIDLVLKDKYILKKPLIFELGSDVPTNIMELDDLCRNYDYELPIKKVRKK